jgi:hypothetical protein
MLLNVRDEAEREMGGFAFPRPLLPYAEGEAREGESSDESMKNGVVGVYPLP